MSKFGRILKKEEQASVHQAVTHPSTTPATPGLLLIFFWYIIMTKYHYRFSYDAIDIFQ